MSSSICGHVHVVDDNPDIRFYLTDLLRQMGYSIEGYDSAVAFLQHSVDIFPAVLVLDVRMPGMSGVDLQDKMKALGRNTPIIFISGESQSEEIIRAMKGRPIEFARAEAEQVGGELPEGVRGATPVYRDGAKVGRNDPCPCGSGKKYKQCHGQLS